VALWREIGDRWGLSFALITLAHHPWVWRDRDRAEGLLREALRAARELGDSHNEAYALSSLGLRALHAGDHGAAAVYFDEGLAIARERGLRRNLANLLTRAARAAYAHGDLDRVRVLLTEASGMVALSAEAEYWYGKLSDATARGGAALATVV
jgi:tetratricopeptide (TPR) repeat protein